MNVETTREVTDDELDAPDGAIVDGWERRGSTWHLVDAGAALDALIVNAGGRVTFDGRRHSRAARDWPDCLPPMFPVEEFRVERWKEHPSRRRGVRVLERGPMSLGDLCFVLDALDALGARLRVNKAGLERVMAENLAEVRGIFLGVLKRRAADFFGGVGNYALRPAVRYTACPRCGAPAGEAAKSLERYSPQLAILGCLPRPEPAKLPPTPPGTKTTE